MIDIKVGSVVCERPSMGVLIGMVWVWVSLNRENKLNASLSFEPINKKGLYPANSWIKRNLKCMLFIAEETWIRGNRCALRSIFIVLIQSERNHVMNKFEKEPTIELKREESNVILT